MRILFFILFDIVLCFNGKGQYFNKSYETTQDALGTYNVNIISQDTFIIFPANMLNNRLGFNSIIINSLGDTIESTGYNDTSRILYTGWSNSITHTHDEGFIMGGGAS